MRYASRVDEPERGVYFLTWRTYGTWLPGDDRGWVNSRQNARGEPMHTGDFRLENAAKGLMRFPPVILDDVQRNAAGDAIREACQFRAWSIHALNVRTNHVHVVLACFEPPEEAQRILKARVSRSFREHGWLAPGAPLWARSGSQRRVASEDALHVVVDYVTNRQ